MHNRPRNIFGILFCLTVFLVAHLGFAQAFAPASYKVGAIKIQFVGTANVSEQVIFANMQSYIGGPLDDAVLDRDIRSLYRTGWFEYIKVSRSQPLNGSVDIILEITPKYRVLKVLFEGNAEKKASSFDDEIKTKAGLTLDERQVKEDVQKIKELYQESGFSQVQVDYSIERDRATNFGTVTFKVREGVKSRITRILFPGAVHIPEKELKKQMETSTYWMFSWLTGSGRLKAKEFEDDIEKLRDYYREKGFLDVNIPYERIDYRYPKPGQLEIRIFINEGQQYKVGNVSVEGNTLLPSDYLLSRLHLRNGMIYTPSLIEKDVERIEDSYGVGGYLDTRAQVVRSPKFETGEIDIEYKIRESGKYYVESVKLEGNTITKSKVILRELSLGPGDVFDMVRMKNSRLRLQNTRFFEDVNVTPESTNIPDRRNLKVAVKEGRTGDLSMGLGFSSLEKLVVFGEIQQSNFDIFNPKSLFRGAGQKFRIRLQLGSESSEATISFEEPWLFGKQLAFGFNLYRTEYDYYSSYYNEARTGVELYIRKRLIEYIEGRFTYNLESVNIRDVSASAPSVIHRDAGKHSVSKFGITLLRDTRDMLINANKGSLIELRGSLAGGPFMADYDYYKMEFRDVHFFPIDEAEKHVISALFRVGVMDSYNGSEKDIPFYDRFYLGGMYTLRGFENRDVGPKENGEPIGGKTYGMISFEYTIAIVDQIRFAVFYDAGFVNADSYDFSTSEYCSNWGIGLRLFLMGAPLSLDYGIPIRGRNGSDKGNQFNFSFGTRF